MTIWGRKKEEYVADFESIAKRVLTEEQWKLFRLHYIKNSPWYIARVYLKLERAEFFQQTCLIERLVGRSLAETKPYALYPLDDYFTDSRVSDGRTLQCEPRPIRTLPALLQFPRIPLQEAA